ncbi:MAG: universal stress protein [Alphaproteobacteria bacterium]|nr:universal stress protein [Alphaproteobacteria bacterium]
MSIGLILAPISGQASDQAALTAAVALARRWSAHLLALQVRPDPRSYLPLMGEGLTTGMIQSVLATAEKDAAERAKNAAATFAATTGGLPRVEHPLREPNASVDYLEETGEETERVAFRGRFADLIVLPQPSGNGPVTAQVVLEAALFETGRPVLLVPSSASATFGERIAIAWNGNREAARAVAAADAFLGQAKAVTVLTVRGKAERQAEPGELVQALAWRGINATAKLVDAGSSGTGPALLAAAQQAGADLLVMGAYGHSRLREFVLGGATREALERAALPVLLCH